MLMSAMTNPETFRVFISAVSDELQSYRQEVARVLRRKELEVRDQEHFRLGGSTLIEQLRDYILNIKAVILLVGDQCGTLAAPEHAAVLGQVPVLEKFRASTGQQRASYTQWEFLLAKHFGKKTYAFFTGEGFKQDAPKSETPEQVACQQAYRRWVKETGEHALKL